MAPIRKIPLARGLLLFAVALLAVAGMAGDTTPSVEGLSSEAILDHLNTVIDWYRNTLTNVPNVGLPSDAMYEFNARSMAAEVAQLAFDIGLGGCGAYSPRPQPAPQARAKPLRKRAW